MAMGYKPKFKPGYNPGEGMGSAGHPQAQSTGNVGAPTTYASIQTGLTAQQGPQPVKATDITPQQTSVPVQAPQINPVGGLSSGERGTMPSAGDAGAGASGGGLDPELDALYQDIFKEHQNSWGDTEKGINAQTAMNQRRSAEINANMGRSIGGGFMGMAAQTQLSGQQSMMGARQTWADRGRQLQLGYLDRQLEEKHRTEDFERDVAGQGQEAPNLTNNPEQSAADLAAAKAKERSQNRGDAAKQFDTQARGATQKAISGLDPASQGKAKQWAYSQYVSTGRWPSENEILAVVGK